VPQLAPGAFKIADNESPRPTDRVFAFGNFYNKVHDLTGASDPGAQFDVYREVFGFESTLFEGCASVELRVPLIQATNTSDVIRENQLGDLTIIGKYAIINNCETGNVVSAGMALTVPTGKADLAVNGTNFHTVLLQPFVGYVCNSDCWYLHGFSSVVIPSRSDDVIMLFTDVGIGYWWFKHDCNDSLLRGIVPTVEGHLLTPLNHRGVNRSVDDPTGSPVGQTDWFVLTGGVNLVFRNNSTAGFAVGIPLTGPRPYDLQVLASFNWRF
jgi:hypothetical protein